MRVLVGCEESGIVRDAFQAHGHDAWSNDVIPARNGGKHIQKCVMKAIVEDGPWDLIILFPECTKMCLSGNRWYGRGKPQYHERLSAIKWTKELWELANKMARVGSALENPTSVLWKHLGKPQYIKPEWFGHKEVKKTGIILDRLPELKKTNDVGPPPPAGSQEKKEWEVVWRMAKSPTRARDRSETRRGIADAMATQWGVL